MKFHPTHGRRPPAGLVILALVCAALTFSSEALAQRGRGGGGATGGGAGASRGVGPAGGWSGGHARGAWHGGNSGWGHGGSYHGHGGWGWSGLWIGAGLAYSYPWPYLYSYPYTYPYTYPYGYPYGYAGSAVVLPDASVTPSQPPAASWYYCDAARAYYPYVASCPGGWRAVPAQPPQPAEAAPVPQ